MSIGKCQQFLRFIFGLMIFLLLFSGGLSRPLSAHAAGGVGSIEITADFDFPRIVASADGAVSELCRRVENGIAAANGIFSEICRKAGAGITAVADFCVAAGETFGREIAAAGRKIAGRAQSFSATAGATAGR